MRFISIFIFITYLLSLQPVFSISGEKELKQLDQYIRDQELYVKSKLERIHLLEEELKATSIRQNLNQAFEINDRLYFEYRSFSYDSAFKYVNQINELALQIGDPDRIADSRIKMGFTLLSSGLFKESLDILESIRSENLKPETRIDFFSVISRTYYDLADYDNVDYFSSKYRRIGNQYLDSALFLMDKNTSAYWSAQGLRRMKANDFEGAADAFNFLLSKYKITDHEFAIATSSLGFIYTRLGRNQESIDMLIKAAIADLKSSTKETVALRNLAVHLYNSGDINRANRYIKIALEDATFYNARHRKIEVGAILPIIEGEWLSIVEKQKDQLVRFVYIVSLLSLLTIISLIIIYLQLKKSKAVKLILQETNENLKLINHDLMEANAIKEEYIGYFFNANSEYIDKIEAFYKNVYRKIIAHQYDDLINMIKSNDLKQERENLFINFDKIFMKLFPHFVEEFNSFFRVEDQIVLKKNELLNPELRIFALIRLGITDNEKIARFLNYSVNTIYTYKTKIKNKLQGHRELFEEKIMDIKVSLKK
jgi:hypothetical protein